MLLELVLVHFDRDIGSDQAIAELDKMGMVPPKIGHTCALGAQHSDLQKQFLIMCLGSVWTDADGDRNVPLGDWDDECWLYLNYWHGDWAGRCRFVVVRT